MTANVKWVNGTENHKWIIFMNKWSESAFVLSSSQLLASFSFYGPKLCCSDFWLTLGALFSLISSLFGEKLMNQTADK